LQNWEKIKKTEGKKDLPKGMLDGLPKNLPSLQRAARIGEKAHRIGFDWPDWQGSWEKVEEELQELKESIAGQKPAEIEHELGDLFFSLCNLSRHLKITPEDAHRKAIGRFEERFRKLEKIFDKRGKDIHTATLEELDEVWEQVKKTSAI
jgi:MazG family protein